MVEFEVKGLDTLIAKFKNFDTDGMLLEIASTLKADIKHRVHVEGLASDGSKIGTYSTGYMKVRTGNFGNSGTYASGKNKGKTKDSGVYVRGKNKGNPRTIYNRDNNSDVVLSLTRQMEKDMDATGPIRIENGYGIGYSNDFNYEKAIWNEQRYKKPVWNLTKNEVNTVNEIVKKYVDEFNN
jgi:hypothetical protein